MDQHLKTALMFTRLMIERHPKYE